MCNVKKWRNSAGRGRIIPREHEEGEISDSRGIRRRLQGDILGSYTIHTLMHIIKTNDITQIIMLAVTVTDNLTKFPCQA